MKYIITTRKVELSEESKEKMLKKLKKLEKFFNDDVEAHVMVAQIRENLVVEMTISFHGMFLRAEVSNNELLTASEKLITAIERQIRKHKTKLEKRLRSGVFDNYTPISDEAEHVEDEKEEFRIIRTKKISAKPMMAEEAVLQMNLLGHDFFLFTNPESNSINIVYKRKDGNYGLIEAD